MTKQKSQLDLQIEYADDLDKKGIDFGFAVGEAFVQSMRNTYYKHTGTALDELIDNSIEAGATQALIALGYSGSSTAKPDAIAVIDDGHGMPRNMLRRAAAWGGTHRHGRETRTGLGRFGFGLPSASVNQARRFSIYSKLKGQDWFSVSIDLDDIHKYADASGKISIPPQLQKAPPAWVLAHIADNMSTKTLDHGTVVLWEKMDRIKWTTTAAMRRNLLPHFGVTFRNYVGQTAIKFDGVTVEPLDPLFITPGYRGFDLDEDRATALEPSLIEIKNSVTGEKSAIRVRYALFPNRFLSVDKAQKAQGNNTNERFKVSNDHLGIIICRMGRQIDVVESTTWKGLEKFRNDDRYWAAEIDFPADLDEEFAVGNSKQGVVMSDNLWERLKDGGMLSAIKELRRQVKVGQDRLKEEPSNPTQSRPSEISMKESEKFRRPRAGNASEEEKDANAKRNFEQHYRERARKENRPEEIVREEALAEAINHPYKVEFADRPGGPFYRIEQRGGMTVLELNRSHKFYTELYASESADRFVRSGLEVLLFSIGLSELDAVGNQDKSSFYTVEKNAWSERLEVALGQLESFGLETDNVDSDDSELAA